MALIETLRAALLASDEQVTVVNFGAGRPGSTKTPAAMRRGRARTGTVGQICQQASKPAAWAELLFTITRDHRPAHCMELGTSLGLSAAYQATALAMNGDGDQGHRGTLHTLEGAEELAEIARRNLAGLGLDEVVVVTGRFDTTLDGVLQSLGTVDQAFIDGHHDEQATIDYFEQMIPRLTPGAVVVFDDISWSDGMRRAWRTIADDDRVRTSIGLRAVGICVMGDHSVPKSHLDLTIV